MLVRHLALMGLLMGLTQAVAEAQVTVTGGRIAGEIVADGRVQVFKGVPFAAPPVGDLRWRPPQPVVPWSGVREATTFGAHCLQAPLFDDMIFRQSASEDCLYLNVWAPARAATTPRPVMLWIHGGGFQAGTASEPRHDGHHLVGRDVVLVTANYRLGVFGFLAHPGMASEAGNHGGNFGLQDMIAALQWIKDNAAAFGGDAGNVTIFGESAGSFAVNALMATTAARGLFHKAIGQSGAFFGQELAAPSREASLAQGTALAASLDAPSLDALRAVPGERVLQAATKVEPWFLPSIDGKVLVEPVAATFAAGRQAPVPLLGGWNADESRGSVVLAKEPATAASFASQVRTRYGDGAAALLEVYPAGSDAEALESAATLAGDLFIGYATWQWLEAHAATPAPVYRYRFNRKIPVAPDTRVNGRVATSDDIGARHAGEIEYVFGTLGSVPGVTWTEADCRISSALMQYWTSFARTGSPGGTNLPKWPRYTADTRQVQYLDTEVTTEGDADRRRYEVLAAVLRAR